jgi:hypothetical protein
MPVIMTVAWISCSFSVCRGIRCSVCFSRAQGGGKEAKENYNLRKEEKLKHFQLCFW